MKKKPGPIVKHETVPPHDAEVLDNSLVVVFMSDGKLATLIRDAPGVSAHKWAEILAHVIANVANYHRLDLAQLWGGIDALSKQSGKIEPAVMTTVIRGGPRKFDFADLHMTYGPDGVKFDLEPVEETCRAIGVDFETIRNNKHKMMTLTSQLYRAHIDGGRAPDPVAETLINESRHQIHSSPARMH